MPGRHASRALAALGLLACGKPAPQALDDAAPPATDGNGPFDGGPGGDGRASPLRCGELPLCDDFESAMAGGLPDPARWARATPNCSGTGRVTIDDTRSHSGAKSVRVDGAGGYCNHVFIASQAAASIGPAVYGRFFVLISDALGDGHVTFLAMRDAADGNRDLRMGGQSQILMWNRESDDATLPALSPAGIALSTRITAGRWTCIEFRIDPAGSALQTWVDGVAVGGLAIDTTPTPEVDEPWDRRSNWHPQLTDFRLGWESYAGQSDTLWFDDVALSPQPIGCGSP
jgi:hypothetical protein